MVQYSPSGLRDDDPCDDGKGRAEAEVEETGLEAPVELLSVEHVRHQDVHDDPTESAQRCREPSRVRPQSLRRDFTNVAPASRSVDGHGTR